MVGEGLRFVALDIYNALFGNGDSYLKSFVTDAAKWLKNKGPGILKKGAKLAFDAIMAAAKGLYEGLIGNSLIPDMFSDIAEFMTNQVPSMLASGAITAMSTLFAIYKSGFNRIANFIAGIWNGISQNLVTAMEAIISNLVSGFNGLIGRMNSAIEKYNEAVPNRAEMDTIGSLEAPSLDSQALSLGTNRTTDVGQLQQQSAQEIRVVLEERTDVVESRIEQGANNVVERRERRTRRNSGTNPTP